MGYYATVKSSDGILMFCATRLSWTFAVLFSSVLSGVYCVKTLGFEHHFVAGTVILIIVPTLIGIVTSVWSGSLIDRLGPKRVMYWAYPFWAMQPALWFFATPATAVYWVTGAALLSGTAATAAGSATMKYAISFPPPEQVPMYMAISDTLAVIAGGLGALAAGIIAKDLGDWKWAAAGWTFTVFHLIFASGVILALAVVALFLPRLQTRRAPGT